MSREAPQDGLTENCLGAPSALPRDLKIIHWKGAPGPRPS